MSDDLIPAGTPAGEKWKNIGIIASVVITLFGVVKGGISKIEEYDSYSRRIEKLEARDQALTALAESSRSETYQLAVTSNDIAAIKARLDATQGDLVTVRLALERMRALLERTR